MEDGEEAGGAASRGLFTTELARAICLAVAAGESLRAVGRRPGMPDPSVIWRWTRARPEFGQALAAAMQAARTARRLKDREAAEVERARPRRLPHYGRASKYTAAVAAEICRRIAEGESLIAITHDAHMPSPGVVYEWIKRHPEFEDAYVEARQRQADTLFDEARENALAATPKTVWADRLRFDTIRWMTARLAPRKYVERLVVHDIEAQDAQADEVRQITVLRFERGPNNEILVIPPQTPEHEAAWVRAHGRPYDGPRVQLVPRD